VAKGKFLEGNAAPNQESWKVMQPKWPKRKVISKEDSWKTEA